MPPRSIMSGWLLLAAVVIPVARISAEEPAAPAIAPAAVTPAPVAPTPAPVTTAPEPAPVVAPTTAAASDPDSAETQLREFRERYASRNWRIGSLGGPGFAFGVHRRIGEHSGLGLNFYSAKPRQWDESGYDAGGISIAWWHERSNRIFPAVVGWSLAAGPMVAGYTAVRGDEQFPIASAFGGAASVSIYAILPVFNILFDARPRGWIPHVTLEWSVYGGIAGRFRNDGDTDLNGDGIPEYRDGERFVDPDGRTVRRLYVFGVGGGGLIWIF